MASFEDSRVAGKTFVRGNTINPETKGEFVLNPSPVPVVCMVYFEIHFSYSLIIQEKNRGNHWRERGLETCSQLS